MNHSGNRHWRRGLLALLLAVLGGHSWAQHAWGTYHWARTANPFTLQVGDNMSADWKTYLALSTQDWNNPTAFAASSTPLTVKVVGGRSSKRTCSMVTGTTQVCNGKYGFNGWLGLASINISGGSHITQGSAKMNDSYFNLATYNNPFEKRHVVCQEVAHTFGLDHQSEDGSSLNTCMDYFSNTGGNAGNPASTTPNAHDFEELTLIYAHLDSTTTLAAGSSSASAADIDISDDPRSWGVLVRQSANGRSSVYERENRNGSKTVTHVYWTPEAALRCRACDHRFEVHSQP
ncbi:hypothetical protein ACFPAG_06325 [Vogesella sp. GCM10023246]|uniref:Peptidase metallopeptidase domain-containing protein n=1 Tax=Vogesella oryzagri TaxID=3160864 RepID=A0ABV1M3P6_9NEIS